MLGDLFPGLNPPRKIDPTLKSAIKEACENLLPSIIKGVVKPKISKVYKFSEFEKAHQLLKSGDNIGKIILMMD